MQPSHWALLGFVAWTILLLVSTVGVPRISAILKKQAKPNSFNPAVPHGSERYQRSMRAHLNCVENLPIFASLVLLGTAAQMSGSLFQAAAATVLPARLVQSVAHISSGRNRAILVRFGAYCVQIICFLLMLLLLVDEGLSR